MSKPPVVLWFRQDLRLTDHAALAAASAAGPVIPVFILDEEAPSKWHTGAASRWWLHHSLSTLQKKCPLVFARGKTETVLQKLLQETGAKAIYFTRAYAAASVAKEKTVHELCQRQGVTCHRFGGFLLHEPEQIKTLSGGIYKVFGAFARGCRAAGESRFHAHKKITPKWFDPLPASDALDDWGLTPRHPDWAAGFSDLWQPGEAGAQQALTEFIDERLAFYASDRDRPERKVTSRLSPHLAWGEISPLTCWQATKTAMARASGKLDQAGEKFLSELLWREFSWHLLFHYPELCDQPFRPEFAQFPWGRDDQALRRWQQGLTGYPIVDAGLRELWQTGTMHNRVRMIVASFLTKHLLIEWQTGAAWFWDTLLDADLASNSLNWQWVAGCGADAAPYFRIFNPILQGEKFDAQGAYVRQWIPELHDVPAEYLHAPWKAPTPPPPTVYPPPIVDHQLARNRALSALQQMKMSQLGG